MNFEHTQYLFYADLNCPYCHAQNERLVEIGVEGKVQWRGVRHMPTLPIPAQASEESGRRLADEVLAVQRREPNLRIVVPLARPNSEPATLLVAAARRVDPPLAEVLKTLCYQALWIHGRDISDPSVLDELRRTAGLPWLAITSADRQTLDAWQTEWEVGAFDRRIPSLMSPRGARLVGLSEKRRVETFLISGVFSSEGDDSCR